MPDPKTICVVRAGGRKYTAWKSIAITHAYTDTIPTFQMTCSEGGLLGGANDSRRLVPQTPVTIELAGNLVLTGAIEVRQAVFDANSHEVVIGGRSATAGAIPSAMPIQAGSFDGYTLEQAARGALAPHGVGLVVKNPPSIFTKPFPFMAVNPGERVGEFIERMAVMRGCFMWGDEKGNLCIGQGDPSAPVVAELQERRNILRASFKLDDQGIFSALHTYAQQPGIGDDMATRTAEGRVDRPGLSTTRIRVEHAEHPGDAEDATARANLHAAQAGWDEIGATVTVAGWVRPDGKLWGITDNVSVYSPMGLPNVTGKLPLGIKSVTYAQDSENGTTTTMVLVKPALLSTTPNADVKTDGKGGYLNDPPPGQPVPPDYQTAPATAPAASNPVA